MNIIKLKLASTALASQQEFYTRLLERSPIIASSEQLCYQVGRSQLCFTQANTSLLGKYHFAFNIPENQFEHAVLWLQQYAPLLPDHSGETVFFSEAWNAHNCYFYDAEGNILELIARHSLVNASSDFSADSLENISEIGIACDDFAALSTTLEADIGARLYQWSGSDSFMPIGDENGLLIIVKPGRIWFPDTGIPALHVPLHVELENEGHGMCFEYNWSSVDRW